MMKPLLVLCHLIYAASPMNETETPDVSLGLVPQPTSVTRGAGKGFVLDADTVIVVSPALESVATQPGRDTSDVDGVPVAHRAQQRYHRQAKLRRVAARYRGRSPRVGRLRTCSHRESVEASGPIRPGFCTRARRCCSCCLLRRWSSQNRPRAVGGAGRKDPGPASFSVARPDARPRRFFLSKDFIKRYIDLLAFHKMNRLHLHLTDSEAWTVEIRAYPRLTNQDYWPFKTADRSRGVYTQDDIRDIVRYAADRNVTVIPEIEIPAHSSVVMAAYPELMCPHNPLRTGRQAWGDKSYEWAEYCPAAENDIHFHRKRLGGSHRPLPVRVHSRGRRRVFRSCLEALSQLPETHPGRPLGGGRYGGTQNALRQVHRRQHQVPALS